jgi:tRNA U34 5-carboxymethylaminomethyl modifying GTPase MnmE/TrmE
LLKSSQESALLYNNLSKNKSPNLITVLNKIDLVDGFDEAKVKSEWITATLGKESSEAISEKIFFVSCLSGKGFDSLESGLSRIVQDILRSEDFTSKESTIITRERHRSHLLRCRDHLTRFLDGSLPFDLAAEEIRYFSVSVCVSCNSLLCLD